MNRMAMQMQELLVLNYVVFPTNLTQTRTLCNWNIYTKITLLLLVTLTWHSFLRLLTKVGINKMWIFLYFIPSQNNYVIWCILFSECDDEPPVSIEALVRSPSLPIHSTSSHGSPSLWTIVMRLQNEIKTLKLDVKNLQLQLNEEKQERTLAIAALQSKNIFKDVKESKC